MKGLGSRLIGNQLHEKLPKVSGSLAPTLEEQLMSIIITWQEHSPRLKELVMKIRLDIYKEFNQDTFVLLSIGNN